MKYQDFLLKNHIFIARREIFFLSFTCEHIGVALVTNMISQLQESFIRILTFWNRKYKYLLYNFISEFHNIFVTGILW